MTERYPHEGEAGGETMTPSPFNVLRLGYRKGRDPRITTHLALVSRALGATNFMLAGDEDPDLFENVASVNERFGGEMTCEHLSGPMGWLKRFTQQDAGDGEPGVAIHLTMYGEPYREVIPRIRRDRPVVVVVGGGGARRPRGDHLAAMSSAAFWKSADQACEKDVAVEVTFVDDEAVAIVTNSPTQLVEAMGKVLSIYQSILSSFGLIINWKKRKE
mgnify:CR=1 FL=1